MPTRARLLGGLRGFSTSRTMRRRCLTRRRRLLGMIDLGEYDLAVPARVSELPDQQAMPPSITLAPQEHDKAVVAEEVLAILTACAAEGPCSIKRIVTSQRRHCRRPGGSVAGVADDDADPSMPACEWLRSRTACWLRGPTLSAANVTGRDGSHSGSDLSCFAFSSAFSLPSSDSLVSFITIIAGHGCVARRRAARPRRCGSGPSPARSWRAAWSRLVRPALTSVRRRRPYSPPARRRSRRGWSASIRR